MSDVQTLIDDPTVPEETPEGAPEMPATGQGETYEPAEAAPATETEAAHSLEDGQREPEQMGFPRMAVLTALDGAPGFHDELDLRWESERWVVANPGEEVLGRWMCLQAVCIAQTAQGLTTVFDAAGLWTLTSRRLVGVLANGKVFGGPINRSGALLVVIPLDEVDAVSMLRERTSHGFKEKAVSLSAARAMLSLDLDRRVDEQKRSHNEDRIDGMRRLVHAVASAKRPGANLELGSILDRADSGDWSTENDDLVAVLAAGTGTSGAVVQEIADAVASTVPAPSLTPPAAQNAATADTSARIEPPFDPAPQPSAPVGAEPITPAHTSTPPPQLGPIPTPYQPSPPRQINLALGMAVPVKESLRTVAFAAAGTCLLLAIVLLLPWQRNVFTPTGVFDESRRGAQGLGVAVLLLAIALSATAFAIAKQIQIPVSRRTLGWSLMGGGLLVLLATLTHVLSTDEFEGTGWRQVGLFLALIAGALVALVGAPFAFLNEGEEDLAVRDAIALARNRGIGTRPQSAAPGVAPAGWYDDPERPEGKRWWDGTTWQMTDDEYHERAKEES